MLKKIGLSFGALVLLLIGILLAIPLLYSIDDLRPKLTQIVEANLQGKVELGKLSFRLFPNVRIAVDGFKVTPAAPFNKEPLVSAAGFEITMPLTGLFTAPEATLVIKAPKVVLITKGEISNIGALLPAPSPDAPPATPSDATAKSAETPKALGETLAALPPFVSSRVMAARFHAEVSDFSASLQDELAPKADKIDLSAGKFSLRNMGLNTPITLDSSILLNVVKGPASVQGPMLAKGEITIKPNGAINEVLMSADVNMDGFDIRMKPLFHKAAGVALSAGLSGKILQTLEKVEANFDSLEFRFANVKTAGKLGVSLAPNNPMDGNLSAAFKVENFDLAPFGALVPMVKDFKLGGKVGVDLAANGKLGDPAIDMTIQLAGVTGATPELQKPIQNLQGKIHIFGRATSPSVVLDPFSMKMGVSDLAIKFESTGLEDIAMKVNVSSQMFNADELLGITSIAAAPAGGAAAGQAAGSPEAAAPVVPELPLDDSLNALAPTVEEALKNPMLDHIKAEFTTDFKLIRFMGADLTDAKMNLSYQKRNLVLQRTGLGAHKGRMTLDMALDLNLPTVAYKINAGLANLQLGDAIAVHMPEWKGVMSGAVVGDFNLSGKGLRKEQLAESLMGGMKGEIKQGRTSLPVVKIVGAIMEALPKFGTKNLELPESEKRKKFNGEFKTCLMDAQIKGRLLTLKTLNIAYDTKNVGIGDLEFNSSGTVGFDRQVELEGTAFMSPEIVRIAELKGPSGKIEIPLKMKGDMSDPKPDTAYTVKILSERIAKNFLKGQVATAAKGAVKKEAEKVAVKAAEEIIKKLPPKAKKDAEKLKKNLLKKFKL